MISELFAFLCCDLSLVEQIVFVSYKDPGDIIIGVLLYLIHPVINSFVGLFISCVINHDDAMSSFVVAGSDGLESLLACSIPDLKFDGLSVNFKSSDFLNLVKTCLQSRLQWWA